MEKQLSEEYWREFLRKANIQEEFINQYATSFVTHHISTENLPELDRDDLKDMGITSVGHKKSILHYINEMSPNQDPQVASISSKNDIAELCTALQKSDLTNVLKKLDTALQKSDLTNVLKKLKSSDFQNTLALLTELANDQQELDVLRVEMGMATTGEIFSNLKDEYSGKPPPVQPAADRSKSGQSTTGAKRKLSSTDLRLPVIKKRSEDATQ